MRHTSAWLSVPVRHSRRLHSDPVTDTLPWLHGYAEQHPVRRLHGYAITDTHPNATPTLKVLSGNAFEVDHEMTKALLISVVVLGLAACGDQNEHATAETATPPILSPTPTPTETPTPSVSLELRLDRTAGTVRITARLTNAGDHAVFYVAGCSGLCRPDFYDAVSFQVTGPDGAEVIVDYPCNPRPLCLLFIQQIPPGEYLERTLELDGTAWKWDMTGGFEGCGVCTGDAFGAGRYTVTARSSYSTNPGGVYTGQVETTAEFEWP